MSLILPAWVKSEEWGRSNRGSGQDYEGLVFVVDARACGDREHVSPTPPQALNAKCLTGRLSDQQLQRATAPPEENGECGGSSPQPVCIACCNNRDAAVWRIKSCSSDTVCTVLRHSQIRLH